MTGRVELCGINTAKLKTLTNDEMKELMLRYKKGDRAARDRLVEGNLRLVLAVLQRFSGRGECADDLFQVGCIGLMKAIRNFDPSKDVRFSTYGVPMIAGEIRRYLRDNSSIRVSRSLRDTAYRVLQQKELLVAKLGRDPTVEELSESMELPLNEVVDAMDAVSSPVSLNEHLYNEESDATTVMDQIGDPKSSDERWLEHIAVKDAFRRLNDRERRILAMRYFEGRTQIEVAEEIGISQAQVSRLEKNALHSVRYAIRDE